MLKYSKKLKAWKIANRTGKRKKKNLQFQTQNKSHLKRNKKIYQNDCYKKRQISFSRNNKKKKCFAEKIEKKKRILMVLWIKKVSSVKQIETRKIVKITFISLKIIKL